jgi:hypothetical protein
MPLLKEIFEFAQDVMDRIKPQPISVTVEGAHYAVVPGQHGPAVGAHIRLPAPTAKHTLQLATLTGFVDAFKADIDEFPDKVAVHVLDPITVALVSLQADEFGRRHQWLRAVCGEENPFPFDTFQTPEAFLIRLQSGFLPTENVIALQRLASSLTTENSVGVADDGLSQVITIKQGTVTRDAITLPPRIELFAYRTFREIDPIASDFMVRLKGKPGELPQIALLQIDAGKWKMNTVGVVSKWLEEKLPDAVVIA